MFSLKKTEEQVRPVEMALDELVQKLRDTDMNSKEYTALVNNVKVLVEANAADKAAYKKLSVSPETWATIGANLAGILLILNFEHAHVLSSKALSHIIKTKI